MPISAAGGHAFSRPPAALIWSCVAVQRLTTAMLKTEPFGSDTFVAVRMRGLPSAPVPNVAFTVTPLAPYAKRDSLSLIVGAAALWARAAGAQTASARTARNRLDIARPYLCEETAAATVSAATIAAGARIRPWRTKPRIVGCAPAPRAACHHR